MVVHEFAPAKINLALHITGQRDNGYHELDMLIGFANHGDTIKITPYNEPALKTISLKITGAYGANLSTDADNLIVKAVNAFIAHYQNHIKPYAAYDIELHKMLPLASGIGGGSADAAATLRAMAKLHNIEDEAGLLLIAQDLGADCPMCLLGNACRASGIGEKLSPIEIPKMPVVLINPNCPIATPLVFEALKTKQNPPLPPLPVHFDKSSFIAYLKKSRNDLTTPATKLLPEIKEILKTLDNMKNVQFSAMSGSGATCFALFNTMAEAETAQRILSQQHPHWWVVITALI
jgi:4-diphosphocytidyl-2-C-methyl-D-erythritol kinase